MDISLGGLGHLEGSKWSFRKTGHIEWNHLGGGSKSGQEPQEVGPLISVLDLQYYSKVLKL